MDPFKPLIMQRSTAAKEEQPAVLPSAIHASVWRVTCNYLRLSAQPVFIRHFPTGNSALLQLERNRLHLSPFLMRLDFLQLTFADVFREEQFLLQVLFLVSCHMAPSRVAPNLNLTGKWASACGLSVDGGQFSPVGFNVLARKAMQFTEKPELQHHFRCFSFVTTSLRNEISPLLSKWRRV